MNASKYSFKALPHKLQVLIVVLTAFAIGTLCWSACDFAPQIHGSGWIMLTLFALMIVPFTIILPIAELAVFPGDIYLMAIAILYGSSTCVIATAFCAFAYLCISRKSSQLFMLIFNFSVMVGGAFLYSAAYQLTKPTYGGIKAMVLPVAMMTLVSFLFTSLATATAISWKRGNRIAEHWTITCLPLVLNSFISAASAAFISLLIPFNHAVPLMFAPLILVIWVWTKAHRNRLMRKTV